MPTTYYYYRRLERVPLYQTGEYSKEGLPCRKGEDYTVERLSYIQELGRRGSYNSGRQYFLLFLMDLS